MKTLVKILVAGILSIALFSTSAFAKNDKKKTAEVTFLTSIECPSCVKKLEATLPFEKGVRDLRINVEDHTIWFEYNPNKTNKLNLARAIERMGFTAEEIQVEKKAEDVK